ncbi:MULTISPECIES: NAD(P)/FAD-dependent oxidoreductase [Serratia]|uniref:NADH dehydrogenase-like protein yjlD n=1 Tax=Serratia ficaria TaxID=61651 RepID=A0A240C7I1_SERFI|nr:MULTISPECIES: FAD-dependent oxidoreductase [Serratia]REF43610.1 NADH dehydrogenase [Serratia ficaria]CAI0715512.1 NADH dehydrogenase-like protein yjlD [Serratia ficaria]CAI0876704.1 NADH dehydrogenase-like protein yjlD [Serratia ficaria]CAI1109676.1 NADH dehydrogenase-like protein yjlD [Serratia ficaria]CAI1118955.1 NADH dehydrogenase-like protein yjlD [Serratia ficaria]
MTQKIAIAGSGFAGFWAAVSAMRAITLAGKVGEIDVTMVSPTPNVTIRPRLYEAVLDNMSPDISAQLAAVGVEHLAGLVEHIDAENHTLTVAKAGGQKVTLAYDRLVLATGSQLFVPAVPGFAEYGFNVDTLENAQRLDAHLKALADKPHSAARNTAVVVGGGLTGLESAAEMPQRLRDVFGREAEVRTVIVDTAPEVGAGMGAEPAAVIRQALAECGVETRAGVRVTAIDAQGVTLSNGERIAANTVILAAGMRANPLTAQIPGERDGSGRIIGDAFLRAPSAAGVFVTGDTVKAATDDAGNHNVMSCQHAMSLGRVAGHNAAAELAGLPVHPYSQPKYVTCLDLGPWGALYTEGWDRQVRFTRQEGKKIKREINTQWIYPPAADRDALFAVANPDFVIVP